MTNLENDLKLIVNPIDEALKKGYGEVAIYIDLYHQCEKLFKSKEITYSTYMGQKERLEAILLLNFSYDIKNKKNVNSSYQSNSSSTSKKKNKNSKSWW